MKGCRIISRFHTLSAETFFGIEREHEELGLEIDARTAVTAWLGEVMDYGMAVEALLSRQ